MEYVVTKRNKLHTTRWVGLDKVLQSERNQS